MKKLTLSIAALATVSAVNAGTMGPVATQMLTPYIVGEASYTWPSVNHFYLNGIRASRQSDGWGGRLGVGSVYNYNDMVGFTGEIGGGYYGHQVQKMNVTAPIGRAWTRTTDIDGYDVLVGAIYKWQYVNLFGEAGFMVENLRYTDTRNLALVYSGGSGATASTTLVGTTSDKGSNTQAFPEIKVGGFYDVTPNLGITVAYMYVFGSAPSYKKTLTSTGGVRTENGYQNFQAPALNTVLFGLRYTI